MKNGALTELLSRVPGAARCCGSAYGCRRRRPGYQATGWFAVFAPTGTPDAMVTGLSEQIVGNHAATRCARASHRAGRGADDGSPAEMRKLLVREVECGAKSYEKRASSSNKGPVDTLRVTELRAIRARPRTSRLFSLAVRERREPNTDKLIQSEKPRCQEIFVTSRRPAGTHGSVIARTTARERRGMFSPARSATARRSSTC